MKELFQDMPPLTEEELKKSRELLARHHAEIVYWTEIGRPERCIQERLSYCLRSQYGDGMAGLGALFG